MKNYSQCLQKAYNAHINVSIRNCNLSKLGITISRQDELQLQFLSLLSSCYCELDIFNEEQKDNLYNILYEVINMLFIPKQEYVTIEKTDNLMINIPENKKELFNRVYKLFADYGIQEIKECQSSCKSYAQSSLQLFNMLQSASILGDNSTEVNNEKQAELIYNYVDSRLKQMGR